MHAASASILKTPWKFEVRSRSQKEHLSRFRPEVRIVEEKHAGPGKFARRDKFVANHTRRKKAAF
jgi:hypothetical protein